MSELWFIYDSMVMHEIKESVEINQTDEQRSLWQESPQR